MSSVFKSEKIYSQELETRDVRDGDRVVPVTLSEAHWAWLDHFRKDRSVETYFAGVMQIADSEGSTYGTAFQCELVRLYRAHRLRRPEGTPFETVDPETVAFAGVWLGHIDRSAIAQNHPDAWWEQVLDLPDDIEARSLFHDGQGRIVHLPALIWNLLDLHVQMRGGETALEPYLANHENDPEAAARALRALAISYFERERKRALSDGVFDARFKRELDDAARLMGI